tara:strand:- start:979 stop:1155 length:177 start_codon:yes stop_codon:yes gene_type:complete
VAKKDKKVMEVELEEEVLEEEPVPEPTPVAPQLDYKVVMTSRGAMKRHSDGTMTPHTD